MVPCSILICIAIAISMSGLISFFLLYLPLLLVCMHHVLDRTVTVANVLKIVLVLMGVEHEHTRPFFMPMLFKVLGTKGTSPFCFRCDAC
jgi:general stress protein CsbA